MLGRSRSSCTGAGVPHTGGLRSVGSAPFVRGCDGNRFLMDDSRLARYRAGRHWLRLGIPAPLTAGAILSGVYMGDKQSPLSDTTLLASGVSDVDLWDHVRGMFPNTIIVGVISLALYAVLGLMAETGGTGGTGAEVAQIQGGLAGTYTLSVLVLLPLVITFGLAIKGYPRCRRSVPACSPRQASRSSSRVVGSLRHGRSSIAEQDRRRVSTSLTTSSVPVGLKGRSGLLPLSSVPSRSEVYLRRQAYCRL